MLISHLSGCLTWDYGHDSATLDLKWPWGKGKQWSLDSNSTASGLAHHSILWLQQRYVAACSTSAASSLGSCHGRRRVTQQVHNGFLSLDFVCGHYHVQLSSNFTFSWSGAYKTLSPPPLTLLQKRAFLGQSFIGWPSKKTCFWTHWIIGQLALNTQL